MAPTDELLLDYCLEKFDALAAVIRDLDDGSVNAVPGGAADNSVYQLATHCMGMARRWSSTVNLGVAVPRDRDGEFTGRGKVAGLLDALADCRAAFEADVRASDLAAPPVAPPAGRTPPWLGSCGGIVLHVFEELCQHLGHAEITRDVVLARRT